MVVVRGCEKEMEPRETIWIQWEGVELTCPHSNGVGSWEEGHPVPDLSQ